MHLSPRILSSVVTCLLGCVASPQTTGLKPAAELRGETQPTQTRKTEAEATDEPAADTVICVPDVAEDLGRSYFIVKERTDGTVFVGSCRNLDVIYDLKCADGQTPSAIRIEPPPTDSKRFTEDSGTRILHSYSDVKEQVTLALTCRTP